MERRNFACTHLTGGRVEQEPILSLGESIFPLTTIEPGPFHRTASNPDTVPTPSNVYLQQQQQQQHQQQQMNINPPTTGTTQQRKRLETVRILK